MDGTPSHILALDPSDDLAKLMWQAGDLGLDAVSPGHRTNRRTVQVGGKAQGFPDDVERVAHLLIMNALLFCLGTQMLEVRSGSELRVLPELRGKSRGLASQGVTELRDRLLLLRGELHWRAIHRCGGRAQLINMIGPLMVGDRIRRGLPWSRAPP